MPPGRYHFHPPVPDPAGAPSGPADHPAGVILDSLSLNNLSGQLEQGKPDLWRSCPASCPRVITEISTRTRVPVIAGGLLRDKADVMAAMRAGASAVSTSAPELWDI